MGVKLGKGGSVCRVSIVYGKDVTYGRTFDGTKKTMWFSKIHDYERP